jgi:hypothetical protein
MQSWCWYLSRTSVLVSLVVGETHQFFFLLFSSSCLVSSSISEVLLVHSFWRSALWPTSCLAFELGFHFVGLLVAIIFCLAPFLWGKVRDLSPGSLLSACYAGVLIVFQFCNIFWLWMLLTDSGGEFCGLLSALFQAAACHPPIVSSPASPVIVYWKFEGRSAPCSFPLLQWAQSTLPTLLHVLFSSLFVISFFFFFFVGQGLICPGGCAGLSQG